MFLRYALTLIFLFQAGQVFASDWLLNSYVVAASCTTTETPETTCTGGIDEDCDGLVDAADPDCGCSQTPVTFSETFEDMADGEEWVVDTGWSENPSSTNIFVGDTAIAYAGSVSGLLDNASGASSLFIQKIHAALGNTGYQTYDYWLMIDDVSVAGYNSWVIISDGAPGTTANRRVEILTNSDDLLISDNASYPIVCAACLTSDTWHHIEVTINLALLDGIDAVTIWMDGAEYGPYDTRGRTDPGSGIDQFNLMTYGDVNNWMDNILSYGGDRCVP